MDAQAVVLVAINVVSPVLGTVLAAVVGGWMERRRITQRIPELTHPRGMR